jgi:FKBP-type peptidyl-prolyl cis-trans isomerase
MKEQEEQTAKMQKDQEAQQLKADEDLEKSGEIAKEFKQIETYLGRKNIKAQKVGKGTYVYIQQPGTGPAVEVNKYLKVKYSGRVLRNDSVFQSNTYAWQLGKDPVIRGWLEGLQAFKQGGKGTLFIPGYLAYGPTPNIPGTGPYEALIFEVEVLEVSDQPIAQDAPAGQGQGQGQGR